MTSSFVDADAAATVKNAPKIDRHGTRRQVQCCTEQLSAEFPTLEKEVVGRIVAHAFAIMHQGEVQVRARARWICKIFLTYSEILQARLCTIFPCLPVADREAIHRAVLRRRALRGAALHPHSERHGFLTFGFHVMVVEALRDVRAAAATMSSGVQWPSHADTLIAVARVMVQEELCEAARAVDPALFNAVLSASVAPDDVSMPLGKFVAVVRARLKQHPREPGAVPVPRLDVVIARLLPAHPEQWSMVQGRVLALLQMAPLDWWKAMRPMERVFRALVRRCSASADADGTADFPMEPPSLPDLVRLVMHDEFPHVDVASIDEVIVQVAAFPVVQRRPNLLPGLVRDRLKR